MRIHVDIILIINSNIWRQENLKYFVTTLFDDACYKLKKILKK